MSGLFLEGWKSRVFWRLMIVLRVNALGYSRYCLLFKVADMSSPISNMASVLDQMRQLTQVTGRDTLVQTANPADAGGFAAEFKRALDKVSSMQSAATNQAKAFTLGEPGIALNDVMIDMQKAGIAFQTTVQVRNRLVAAYQEVASMPV